MKKVYIILFVASAFLLQLCTTKKRVAKATQAKKVTYVADVQPLVIKHCSPCHIPPQGKKEPLNTYATLTKEIDDVIASIRKNPGEHGFMPARRAKLSDSTINVFVDWKSGGLLEQ